MNTNNIVFNGNVFSFNDNTLNSIFSRLLANERVDDEEEQKYTLSFVSNSFIKKSYEELELHEFLLEGDFRASQLICNIENVFGPQKAALYADVLSDYWEDDIDLNTTDWFDSISTSDAVGLASKVYDEQDLDKFKLLLASMFVYELAQLDYEQTIEDMEDFKNLHSCNGIVFRVIQEDETYILKPVFPANDSSLDKYVRIKHVLVAPQIVLAVYRTLKSGFFSEDLNISAETFFLKLEQLACCTSISQAPVSPVSFNGGVDPQLVGKWYKISKMSGFGPSYDVQIDWYKADGTMCRSVVFECELPQTARENWTSIRWDWKTSSNQLYTKDSHLEKESVEEYSVDQNVLHVGKSVLYKTYEDAMRNIK